jgi:hypothetical protein
MDSIFNGGRAEWRARAGDDCRDSAPLQYGFERRLRVVFFTLPKKISQAGRRVALYAE